MMNIEKQEQRVARGSKRARRSSRGRKRVKYERHLAERRVVALDGSVFGLEARRVTDSINNNSSSSSRSRSNDEEAV